VHTAAAHSSIRQPGRVRIHSFLLTSHLGPLGGLLYLLLTGLVIVRHTTQTVKACKYDNKTGIALALCWLVGI